MPLYLSLIGVDANIWYQHVLYAKYSNSPPTYLSSLPQEKEPSMVLPASGSCWENRFYSGHRRLPPTLLQSDVLKGFELTVCLTIPIYLFVYL